MDMQRKTFRELFCERNRIAPRKFEQTMLRLTLYRGAAALYWLWRIFLRKYLSQDIQFLKTLGNSRSYREAKDIFDEYSSDHYQQPYVRLVMKIRISKKKALRLAEREFVSEEPHEVRLAQLPRKQNIRTA